MNLRGFTLLVACLFAAAHAREISICSYNIRKFSDSTVNDPKEIKDLVKIISGCHMIAIQELQDRDDSTPMKLRNKLREAGFDYGYIASNLLGYGKKYKERMLAYYKKREFKVVAAYQSFNDTGIVDYSEFARPPFSVLFEHIPTGNPFVVTNVHLTPTRKPAVDNPLKTNVHSEMNALVGVYDTLKSVWGQDNVKYTAIVGDFNAGLTYYPKLKWWPENKLRNDERFQWLTKNDFKTMVDNDNAHDKIIVTQALSSDKALRSITTITNFDTSLSDHLPLKATVELKGEGRDSKDSNDSSSGGTQLVSELILVGWAGLAKAIDWWFDGVAGANEL